MPLIEWPANIIGTPRSGGWNSLRDRFIEENNECLACGKKDDLECHHILDFANYPELELEWSNLVTLCQRCHLVIGHLNSYHRVNPNVIHDSKLLRSRHIK
jgi:5-methylcytosine-specific restriction endonuclease McrA